MKNVIRNVLMSVLFLFGTVVSSEAADRILQSYFVWNAYYGTDKPNQQYCSGSCTVRRSIATDRLFLSSSSTNIILPSVDDEIRLNGTVVRNMAGYGNGDITDFVPVGTGGTALNFAGVDTGGGVQSVTALYVIKVNGIDATAEKLGTAEAESTEPINAVTGNLWFRESDLFIPCTGLPLGFERRYNSVQTNASYGAMGKGWAHNYDWSLSTTFDFVNTWMTLRTGEGEEHSFYTSDGVNYVSQQGLKLQLVLNSDAYRLRDTAGTCYTFPTNNYLLLSNISNPWGQSVNLTYTNVSPTNLPATNLLTTVQHSTGQRLDFTYTSNLLTKVSAATNLYMSFVYNGQGFLTNATRTVGNISEVSTYLYNNGLMTQKVDAVGTVYSYGFGADGRATNLVTSGGYYQHSVSNDYIQSWTAYRRGNTALTNQYIFDEVTNNIIIRYYPQVAGYASYDSYKYATSGDLVKLTSQDNGASRISYSLFDSNHNLTNSYSMYSFDTSVYFIRWNYKWNLIDNTLTNVLDPEGGRTVFEYTNSFLTKTKVYYTNNLSYDTVLTYTTNGLVDTVTNANGHFIKNNYDQYGYRTSSVPQVGPVNYCTYSSLGILQSVRLPDGDPLQAGGSGIGISETNTNPTPRIITYNSDALGRLTNVVYITNTMMEFLYWDALGNLTNKIDTAGRSTRFTYKPTGKLSSVSRTVGGSNLTTSIDYDQQFNTLNIRDAKGRAVESYLLDNMDRVVSVTNLEKQTMSVNYLFRDLVAAVNRFDGTTVTNTYNGLGLLTTVGYPSATLNFTYGKNGILKSARNSACTITNIYNMANRMTNTTVTGLISVPVQTTYNYLPAGNVSNVVSIAGTNTYGFDAAERVTSIDATRAGKSKLSFTVTYNGTNGMVERITCTNNALTVGYGYDMWDRVAGMSWSSSNMSRSFGYSYNSANMISSLQDSGIGGNTVYGYDELDRLVSENKADTSSNNYFTESIAYDEVGNRTNKIRDGVAVNYSYSNGCNRLTGWTVTQTNLSAVVDVYGVSSTNISWDSHWGQLWVSNQFKATPQGSGSNFWLTDFPVGLGTQKVVAAIRNQAGNTKFVTNQIFMSIITNSAYQYDAAGCVTNIAYLGTQYSQNLGLVWDTQYQLQEVRTNGVSAERNGYDAAGKRVWNWDGTATNYFIYDGANLIAEVNNTGALKRTYIYAGLDFPLAMTVYTSGQAQTYCFILDKQGSVKGIVDESGTVVEQYRLDAWGKVLGVYDGQSKPLDRSAIGNRILAQGREYSWQTGLYYYRARWVDPSIGRFISKDPLRVVAGVNDYVFCGNSSPNSQDPFGLCPKGGWAVRATPEEMLQRDIAIGGGGLNTADSDLFNMVLAALTSGGSVAARGGAEVTLNVSLASASRQVVSQTTDGILLGVVEKGNVRLFETIVGQIEGHADLVRKGLVKAESQGFSIGVKNGQVTTLFRNSTLNSATENYNLTQQVTKQVLNKLGVKGVKIYGNQ